MPKYNTLTNEQVKFINDELAIFKQSLKGIPDLIFNFYHEQHTPCICIKKVVTITYQDGSSREYTIFLALGYVQKASQYRCGFPPPSPK